MGFLKNLVSRPFKTITNAATGFLTGGPIGAAIGGLSTGLNPSSGAGQIANVYNSMSNPYYLAPEASGGGYPVPRGYGSGGMRTTPPINPRGGGYGSSFNPASFTSRGGGYGSSFNPASFTSMWNLGSDFKPRSSPATQYDIGGNRAMRLNRGSNQYYRDEESFNRANQAAVRQAGSSGKRGFGRFITPEAGAATIANQAGIGNNRAMKLQLTGSNFAGEPIPDYYPDSGVGEYYPQGSVFDTSAGYQDSYQDYYPGQEEYESDYFDSGYGQYEDYPLDYSGQSNPGGWADDLPTGTFGGYNEDPYNPGVSYPSQGRNPNRPWYQDPRVLGTAGLAGLAASGILGDIKGKQINPVALPGYRAEDAGLADSISNFASKDIGSTDSLPFMDKAIGAVNENLDITKNPHLDSVISGLSEDYTNQLKRGLGEEERDASSRGLTNSSIRTPRRERLALESSKGFADIASRIRSQDYDNARNRQLNAVTGAYSIQSLLDSLKSSKQGRGIAALQANRPQYLNPRYAPSEFSQNIGGIGQIAALLRGGLF